MKGAKAIGKRLTTYQVSKINELEPLIQHEKKVKEETKEEESNSDVEEDKDDKNGGQMSIF